MSPSKRVVSTREVSRKVLGSANPFAKGFRDAGSGCASSISGIFLGFILFGFAFWPAWCSVRGVEEQSKAVEALPLLTAEQVEGQSGMVKFSGEPVEIEAIELDIECRNISEYIDVFWYHMVLEEFTEHIETVERTETEIQNGQEVEVTYEDEVEVRDWEVIDETEERAGGFNIGNIEIDPANAQLNLADTERCEDRGREEIGEESLTVEWVPIDDLDELLVVGNVDNNRIRNGAPFIITDKSADELVTQLETQEKASRWWLTIFSIILFFIAFNLIIGPLLFILKYVPVLGAGLRALIGFVSLIIAIIWVLILKFIIAFWWLILIIFAVIIGLLIVKAGKKGDEEEEVEEAKEAVEIKFDDKSKQNFCPECGDKIDPGEKFCNNCGDKLG